MIYITQLQVLFNIKADETMITWKGWEGSGLH